MTGYGRAEGSVANQPCSVEVRTVNGRHLELSTRLPKQWADKELAVRELIRERVTRGSVSLFIRLEEGASQQVVINSSVARLAVDQLRALRNDLALAGDITISDVLSIPAVFQGAPDDAEAPDPWPELSALIVTATESLTLMRDKEGAELERDFDARLLTLAAALADVEQRSALRIPAERERLRERVAQLINDGIDEQRLQLEIVLLSEKLDVAEECTRLRSHIKFFRETMTGTAAAGRKLNFLLQEMNREVNTIGSKCNDAEIARVVVGMKEDMERMREQIQNIE
jgi:uncharacterized protein (TIGR00255 family)